MSTGIARRFDSGPEHKSHSRTIESERVAVMGLLEFDNTYPLCRAFGGAYGEVVMDTERAGYRRLAECIAAEEAE